MPLDRIKALYGMYTIVVMQCESHINDNLLFAHAEDMQHHLKIMVAKGNLNNSLAFTKKEAIAFEAIWRMELLNMDQWHEEIIRSCLSKVNKFLADTKAQTINLN